MRMLLAAFSFLSLLYAGWQYLQIAKNFEMMSGNAHFSSIPYNDATKAAIQQKLEGAKNLAQSTLLVLAVLWGLIIAKKEERALFFSKAHLLELAMFFIANLLFASSLYCYSQYNDAMSSVHIQGPIDRDEPADIVIMNFRDDRINDFYKWQERFWIVAIAVTGATLVCAHGIRPLQMNDSTVKG